MSNRAEHMFVTIKMTLKVRKHPRVQPFQKQKENVPSLRVEKMSCLAL